MSEQPNALRLASLLRDESGVDGYVHDEAATELERLHAENEATRADIERYVRIASELEEAREQDRIAMREALEAALHVTDCTVVNAGSCTMMKIYDPSHLQAAITDLRQRLEQP